MKQSISMFITLLFISFYSSGQSNKSIVGKWQDEKHPEKQIEIFEQSARIFFGKAIAIEKKEEPFIFENLVWNEKTKSYQGILRNPDGHDKIMISILLVNPNRFVFVVKKFFLSKTFQFIRAS